MGYLERAAPPGLGLAVAWEQTVAPDAAPHVQRVVPDGQIDLIWFAHEAELVVAGPDTGPQLTEVPPGGRLIGVRFHPGLATPALGLPADAVRNGRIPLHDLWGPEADALTAHLAATHPEAAFAGAARVQGILAGAVADRVRRADPADPIVPALVTGGESVREMAGRLGLSERQLRRRSLAAFGYGPKTLQRILRFQRALRLFRAGRPAAEVAYEAGYADQAHLSHEVRELAGVPLSVLR